MLTPGAKTNDSWLKLTDAEATCAAFARVHKPTSMNWTCLAHKQQSSNTVVTAAQSRHKCRTFSESATLVCLSSHPETLVEFKKRIFRVLTPYTGSAVYVPVGLCRRLQSCHHLRLEALILLEE